MVALTCVSMNLRKKEQNKYIFKDKAWKNLNQKAALSANEKNCKFMVSCDTKHIICLASRFTNEKALTTLFIPK